MRNLHKEFESRGLAKDVCIIGPDAFCSTEPMPDGSMSRDKFAAFTWLNRAAKDIPQVIGAYDLHWYANDDDVRDGLIEQLLREKRELLLQTDPQARTKPIFIGESGMLTGKINGDQQPRVKLFEYGVLMADYVAQVARAGWMSASAWDLDDAMHLVVKGPAPPVPGDLTLKIWGFWNSQAIEMGKPEDNQRRPWFYTWTLMSRLFPKGSRIVQADGPGVPQLRVMAGTDPARHEVSIMLVNNYDQPRTIQVRVPGAGVKDLKRYHFFDGDRPADADGFPLPKESMSNVDLDRGLAIALPSRGVVFLTTLTLVRHKPTAYGRATLGAKPFRRALK